MAIQRVKIVGHAGAQLSEGRDIACQYGYAHCKGLGQRNAIALGDGGEKQGACAPDPGHRRSIRQAAEFQYPPLPINPIQHGDIGIVGVEHHDADNRDSNILIQAII